MGLIKPLISQTVGDISSYIPRTRQVGGDGSPLSPPRFPPMVSVNFRSLENYELGHCPLQPPLKKIFLHGVRVLVRGHLRVRVDLPIPLLTSSI